MDIRPVLYIIGIFLSVISVAMLLPMAADLMAGSDDWQVFAGSSLFVSFIGIMLIVTNKQRKYTMTLRQGFLMTTLSWVAISFFAALPFYFSKLGLSYTDALFETISGITTTGSTVLKGLDSSPPGILLWRSLLQWLGGLGFIVMALSLLPFLKVGGMQLFKLESSQTEKAAPKAAQLATSIGLIYLTLTFLCYSGYIIGDMTPFDALNHAMTTIATGGYSTHDASFGYFDNKVTNIVAIIFMLCGSIPFVLYVYTLNGNSRAIPDDSQVRWFFGIVLTACIVTTAYSIFIRDASFEQGLLRSTFNVVSLITGTGYSNADYNQWGSFFVGLAFFLMVIGGCAGSTTCGIKIFRFQILYKVSNAQLKQLIYPHGVFTPYYNGRVIPREVSSSVMSFFFLYALCFSVIALLLSFTGLDFLTALSGAATSISNVGPGLGDIIGPGGTFQSLPDASKWVLCVAMLLGRLELFTILVLLSPYFWRR